MKFAIRDDDLNYYYTPECIEENFLEISNICPISMATVPMVKGNWRKNTDILEKAGPGNVPVTVIKEILNDNQIYPISANKDLIEYIKEKIALNEISIAIHGIHHRNNDESLPVMKNNFSIGAEFNTTRNLTTELSNAVKMLQDCFGVKIQVFTPPQNSYSRSGALAIFQNRLNICGYLPGIKNWRMFVDLFGYANYLKYFQHRLQCKKARIDYPFPQVIRYKDRAISDHTALQPSTSIDLLLKKLYKTYDQGGDFILSTHSYGFNYKMLNSEKTMKDSLLKILNEASKLKGIKFVTLNDIFKP